MKRIFSILVIMLCAVGLHAQEMVQADSVIYRQSSALDSTLLGKSIFDLLPSKEKGSSATVTVHQSQAISSALSRHIANGPKRTLSGYRVRIYFDNAQNARGASEQAMGRFVASNPGIPAYRSYQNPFFKVTVGDFRTRSEAVELLENIKGSFPSAFVVKENINYPSADRAHSYVADTVKVYRKAL